MRACGGRHTARAPQAVSVVVRSPASSATVASARVQVVPSDDFIIIATDGLWEFISTDDAVEIVAGFQARREPAFTAARFLIAKASLEWRLKEGTYRDDITCIIVYICKTFSPMMCVRDAATRDRRPRWQALTVPRRACACVLPPTRASRSHARSVHAWQARRRRRFPPRLLTICRGV